MPAVNEVRGEAALTLAGVEYPLRPSYEAVTAIERLTGVSQYQLANAAAANALALSAMGVVVAELIKAHAREHGDTDLSNVRAERIGQLIHESNSAVISLRLAAILLRSAHGGYTVTGEAKAAETDMTEIPSAA